MKFRKIGKKNYPRKSFIHKKVEKEIVVYTQTHYFHTHTHTHTHTYIYIYIYIYISLNKFPDFLRKGTYY